MPFHLQGPGIHIAAPQAQLTAGTRPKPLLLNIRINRPQTRIILPPPKRPPPSQNPIFTPEEDQGLLDKTRTAKTISSHVPSIVPRKGAAEVLVSDDKTDPLPVVVEADLLPGQVVRTIPRIPGNYKESLPRNTNRLQRRRSFSSSSPVGTPQQQQNLRPSSSSEDAAGNQSHRRSPGPFIAGLLQSSVPGSQTRRVLPSNHPPQEINPLHAKFFRGNINIYLHFVSFMLERFPLRIKASMWEGKTTQLLGSKWAALFIKKALNKNTRR